MQTYLDISLFTYTNIYAYHSNIELFESAIQNFYEFAIVMGNFIPNTENKLFFPIFKPEETI